MNKLIAVLVASLFAVSAFAGGHSKAPAADTKAPAAAAAPAAEAPADKKEKSAKKEKAAEAAASK